MHLSDLSVMAAALRRRCRPPAKCRLIIREERAGSEGSMSRNIRLQKCLWLLLLVPLTISAQEVETRYVSIDNEDYPLYPTKIRELPALPSPCVTKQGVELVIAHTLDDHYLLFPVTVENGDTLDYKRRLYGKGRQLAVDAADFPTLARAGLHSVSELDRAVSITGRPVAEITRIGRPMQYSRAGFLRDDEDIVSVLKQDDRLVRALSLTHAELAKPLFHLWNIVLEGIRNGVWLREEMGIDHIFYNGIKVHVRWQGGRGWQESIFHDEILGQYHLEMWRDVSQDDISFLEDAYPDLTREEMARFIKNLSYIHTGEMVPYYIMRYGFYEGHTDFRADPVAIAYVFGLKNVAEIEDGLSGRLFELIVPLPGG